MIIKNIERDKYTSVIHDELNKLGLEFSRYKERWDKLAMDGKVYTHVDPLVMRDILEKIFPKKV